MNLALVRTVAHMLYHIFNRTLGELEIVSHRMRFVDDTIHKQISELMLLHQMRANRRILETTGVDGWNLRVRMGNTELVVALNNDHLTLHGAH